MNFVNRYELSESITTGAVETFPARDVISDSRVLVYVFESGAPQPANVPTIEWVLEAFNKIAPAPRDLVINAGRYSGTAFLYLVTKMPAPDALNQWIEAYERYRPETREYPPIPRPDNRESRGPQGDGERKKAATSALPAPASDSDAAKSGFGRLWPAEAPEVQTADSSPDGRAQSGAFASSFLAGFNKSAETRKAAEERHPTGPGLAGSTRDRFATPPDSVAGAPRDRASGEFTKFFKGPFSGEASPDTPRGLAPTPVPEPTPGEFTRLFGRFEKASRAAPAEPKPRIETDELRLSETLSQGPRASFDPATLTPPIRPASKPPAQADLPGRPVSSAPPATPAWQPDAPVLRSELPPPLPAPTAAGYGRENATQLFSYSGRTAEPELPAGPSEYTRIISRPSTPLAESRVEPPRAGAGARIPVPLPPVSLPPFAGPAVPGMASFPPMPAAAAPPNLPQAEPQAKPVSYWPLILAMTVLFFLAALLVMYFVLKH